MDNLNWVGFNESNSPGQADSKDQLRKTRVRAGFLPSTIGFNLHKTVSDQLSLASRVELGIQITNIDPAFIADPTWMEPRAVYLDLSGGWGSVHAGRDLSLFPRSNLYMNYDLGHAYGVGFPCSYERVFGGACGHVGFGTLWPDYRAQIAYSTPNFGDVFQITVGVFDPRTVPTYNWDQTPLPRIESEAVASYGGQGAWSVKAWGNGFWQKIGTSVDFQDATTQAVTRKDFSQNAYGVGGGLQGKLGPFKAGVSGYTGKGMDAFELFTFNPITIGQDNTLPDRSQRRFRKTSGFLAEASFSIGSSWVMARLWEGTAGPSPYRPPDRNPRIAPGHSQPDGHFCRCFSSHRPARDRGRLLQRALRLRSEIHGSGHGWPLRAAVRRFQTDGADRECWCDGRVVGDSGQPRFAHSSMGAQEESKR